MNTASLRIGLSLTALFALGVGTGFVLGWRLAPPVIPAVLPASAAKTNVVARTVEPDRVARRWCAERLGEYRVLLNLTDQQVTAIEKQFDGLVGDYGAIRKETQGKMTEAFNRLNRRVAEELTPEQRKLFWQHLRSKARRTGT